MVMHEMSPIARLYCHSFGAGTVPQTSLRPHLPGVDLSIYAYYIHRCLRTEGACEHVAKYVKGDSAGVTE